MKKLSLVLSLAFPLFCLPAAMAQEVEVFSISDQIKAQNDCTDRENGPCRDLFNSTCEWVGASAITIATGLERNIPEERIQDRIIGDLVEIGEGSGGYVDIDLANAFIEPLWNYFASGQYAVEMANSNGDISLGLGMMLGGEITGSLGTGSANEYMQEVKNRQQAQLSARWKSSCLESAYEW